jgi:alpha-L-rhamnosidase
MTHLRFLTALLLLTIAASTEAFAQADIPSLKAEYLRCEYRINPDGIDILNPMLSWIVTSVENGQKQTAFRILAASTPEILATDKGDLWDSGKKLSDQTIQLEYAGRSLQSRMQVWWKVQVWDKDGKLSSWSKTAHWSMGLLRESDWEAKWIADSAAVKSGGDKVQVNGFHSQISNSPDKEYWVIIDLGKEQEFEEVCLFPARPFDFKDTPGFLFPVKFKIESAAQWDFSDAKVIVNRTAAEVPNPGDNAQTYKFPKSKGRYVRLTVTRLALRDASNYAFALAEMQVLENKKNLALKAKVYAPDAIEGENWKSEFLTDGRTATTKVQKALPATYARRSFSVGGQVKKATAYVSAMGLYEFRINGKRVGDQLLAPEWTTYDKRISYQTYDVTSMIQKGENAAAAIVGEGWYAGQLMVFGRFAYGNYPRFLAQLEIELTDGTTEKLGTDESWNTNTKGPITASGIYAGETYDARLEESGWDLPGFTSKSWTHAIASNPEPKKLVWLRNEPIKVEQELHPKKITEPAPGIYVIDFGQNMVGWCHFDVEGKTGQAVIIRHGEAVNPNGRLYTENLRQALQIDTYIPGKDGPFEFEPRFTYHGFRYVEITGLTKAPTKLSVTGRVFHSSSPFTGDFECSDASLNQLMSNIQWTERANLMSSPNDCPQRDERFGWMGDIQAFAQTGVFNMDLAAFITKFAQDTRDDQADDGRFPDFAPHPGDQNLSFSGTPAWGDAGVFVPWTAYLNYGDTRLLNEHFDAARRWVDYIQRNNPDLIWKKGRNNDYNDWLNADRIIYEGWPKTGGEVPQEVFATAFFARSTQIVASMAAATGRAKEAEYYGRLADQIKNAFNREFVKPDGRITGDTQGGYALALSFNLLPEEMRTKAAKYIVENMNTRYNGHLSTGIQTTHRAMQELTKNGYSDIAWKSLMNRSFPSWMYMIDNGATTIWERWDGYVEGRGFQDPGMNSLNHWALGAVGEWIWRNIAGLNPDENQPGWKHFTIAPLPGGGVTSAKGEYQSIRGLISSSWKIKDGKFIIDVKIPANTSATIMMPEGVNKGSGNGVSYNVESGNWHFESKF